MTARYLICLAMMPMALIGCNAPDAGLSRPASPTWDSSASPAARGPSAKGAAAAADKAGDGYRTDIQAGTLTAGSFDDAAESGPYYKFVGQLTDGSEVAALAKTCHAHPIVLRVQDSAGRPVGQARVRVGAEGPPATLALRTRTDGRCVVLPPWDKLGDAETLSVDVTAPGSAEAMRFSVSADKHEHTLTLPAAEGKLPEALDLAFVVDCTGSMSDELEYLKVELRHIAQTLAKRFPKVRQRYALIVYRDTGDDYVTRVFNFTDSLAKFTGQLGPQRAAGGGDYPEAVDQALAAAGQLRWADQNTARVAFHVADAPPHTDRCERALRALDPLRAEGVAVYPVASSGVADVAEFIMRTEALLTGSEYLFLTDDSGVGLAHAKPHFPHYHVQTLRAAMIRVIASELSGKRLAPEPKHILRTVTAAEAVEATQ